MDSFTPKSSFLEKAEYDEQQRSMTLTFKTGSQTRYMYVFPATWLSFKEAKDHSSYYANAIKGRLMSIGLQKHNIGRQSSTPLKQHKLRRPKNGSDSIFTAGIVNRVLKQASGRKIADSKPAKRSPQH